MFDFQLQYKGSRNYLHGSDIYNAIDDALRTRFGGHLIRLTFKHFARNQCRLMLEKTDNAGNIIGQGNWSADSGELHHFWLYETDCPVIDSYPYDEDAITASACIDGAIITGSHNNHYSVIENIIALTKRLNYTLSPDVKGKWLFGQLDLKQNFPDNWQQICVERTVCVGNNFSRNRILIDGTDYGEIRFIGGQP